MASGESHMNRLSVEEGVIADVWKYSHQAGAEFDPARMNQALNVQKQMRKETQMRQSGFSMSGYLDSPEVRDDNVSRFMKRRSTNLNLQKSLALLDDAVGTPQPLLRSGGKKTPSSLRRTAVTPKFTGSLPSFNMSSSTAATPGHSMMATKDSTMVSQLGDSTYSGLFRTTTPRQTSLAQSRDMPDLEQELTTTNVALLLEEDPGLAASESVFTEFAEAMQTNQAEHQIFQLVAGYESICTEQVDKLEKLVRRAAPSQTKHLKVNSTLEQLKGEKSTWRLISSLYRDRLETEMKPDTEEPMMLDSLGKHVSDKEIIKNLYDKEAPIRQAQLVVDWLELNAEEELAAYQERVEFFTDQTAAWENTLHSLHQQRQHIPMSTDRPMVDKMDPDAPIRQKRPLADLDQEDEVRLLKFVFACIRAGQLGKAQELCSRCGQEWRAATLEGWRLCHDPNFNSGSAVIETIEGNPYRDIWKVVCWRLAENEAFHRFERAVYASLAGHLQQVLPVCDTWYDCLWAYIKVMVDTRVEQEIRIQTTAVRTPEQLPSTYWDKPMSMESIFRELQASPNERVKVESKQRFALIQKYIILGDTDALVEEMYEWVKEETNQPPKHILRFMAHLILFFRAIGISTKEELCTVVLETYVRSLIEDGRTDLVAFFVARLPQDLQVEWYARFLEGISKTDERQHCLALADEAGLNVQQITRTVVENIRNRDRTEFSLDTEMTLDTTISEDDQLKIEAIEWLVFDPSQRSEAIQQANAVMRTFLALQKLNAARAVFNKIPAGSIDVIMRAWQQQTGMTELNADDANTVREYLCIKAYLDAQDSFNDWFKHYHTARPSEPEDLRPSNFTERVAHEHREKQFKAELERWQHTLMLQTETTVEKIYNVLLFIDGGWMVDQRKDTTVDEGREQQMRRLRQMCIPSMFILAHKVLHTTSQYHKCLQLADMVSSEQHQLYTVFSRDQLQKFLHNLHESSVELLNKNKGPLGYDLA